MLIQLSLQFLIEKLGFKLFVTNIKATINIKIRSPK